MKMTENRQRISALDGWRGIAILLVLTEHFTNTFDIEHTTRTWLLNIGQHGVALFFVLSGFLITRSLLELPNLGTFYKRRLFRLLPVAWAYLAFLFIAHIPTSRIELAGCLLFFRNYVRSSGNWPTEHFWSLSIEEQFYLAWPAVLIMLGAKRAKYVVIFAALAVAAFRFTHWQNYDLPLYAGHETVMHVDTLCVGCILALVLRPSMARVLYLASLPALACVVFCAIRFDSSLIPLTESVAFAVLIGNSALSANRILSSKPLVWLGNISYSLYVWQEIVLVPGRPHPLLLFGLVLAPLSYYLIERPMIRLGRRTTRQTLNSVTSMAVNSLAR